MPYPTKTTSDLSTLISGSRRADEATKSSGYFRSIVLSPIVNDIRGSLLIPARGTSCVYVPSGFPGFNPIFLNWSLIYLTESSSPFVPGARPSNSSDARTLMCASKPSGVIASSAGCKRNANSSAARTEVAATRMIGATNRSVFTFLEVDRLRRSYQTNRADARIDLFTMRGGHRVAPIDFVAIDRRV